MSLGIKIGDTYLDLPSGEELAVDYAVNEIGDLSTRNGIKSARFTIPLTVKNRAALDFNNVLQNFGQDVNARIDGAVLQHNTINKGYFQLNNVDVADQTASLTFYSGNVDWLQAIRGRTICELTSALEAYNHLWTEEIVRASYSNTKGYVYVATDTGRLTNRPSGTGIDLEDMSPAVFLHTIFQAIFQDAGFVLKGNFLNDSFFKSLVIPFSGEVVANGDEFVNDFTQTVTASNTVSFGDSYPGGPTSFYVPSPVYTVPADLGAINVSLTIDCILKDFLLTLTATTTPATTAQLSCDLAITKNQSTVLATKAIGGASSEFGGPTEQDSFDAQSFSFSLDDVQLVSGDTIEFAIIVQDGAVSGSSGNIDLDFSTRTIFVEPNVEVPENGLVYVAEILPCLSQEELVKYIAVSFGLLFQVDNFSREVQIFTFEEIANNQINALDWTSKIDSAVENVSFDDIIRQYNKKNYLTYEGDSDDDLNVDYENRTGYPFGSGSFDIDSDFIPDAQEVYAAPFAGSFTRPAFIDSGELLYLPKIQRYSSSSLSYYEADITPANRILVYAGLIPLSTLSQDTISTMSIVNETTNTIPFAYFYKSKIGYTIDVQNQSIAYNIQEVNNPNDYGLINTYWKAYREAIDTNRYLSLSMRLTGLDIATLDFSKPVYLDKSGITGYYFIDKINGFVGSEKSTVVDFVKLGGDISEITIQNTAPEVEEVIPPTNPPITQPCIGSVVLRDNVIATKDFTARGWAVGNSITVYWTTVFTANIIQIDSFRVYLDITIPGILPNEAKTVYDMQIDNNTLLDTVYTCAN